jgi:hypothetical protein
MAKPILALPTHERLHKLFTIDPETGVFTSKKPNRTPNKQGGVGNFSLSYQRMCVDGVMYPAHRIAYIMYHGDFPLHMYIDHINGDRLDNRVLNLRLVTNKQNAENTARNKSNSSGFKGVHWHKRLMKWAANIRTNYYKKHLGYFDRADEAYAAYCAAANDLFTHDNRRGA